MAIEIKFTCSQDDSDFLKTSSYEDKVVIHGCFDNKGVEYHFDIPTSIKLSKSIRTEINKIKGI